MNAAHLHLMINHIPVLGAFASLALLAYAFMKNHLEIYRLTLATTILIGVLTVPAFLSGEPAEKVIEDLPGFSESLIEPHEDFSKVALISTEVLAVLSIIAFLQLQKTNAISKPLMLTLIAVAIVNSGAMMYTAYLGGQIVHKELRNEGS